LININKLGFTYTSITYFCFPTAKPSAKNPVREKTLLLSQDTNYMQFMDCFHVERQEQLARELEERSAKA